jgi:hypothetical protein
VPIARGFGDHFLSWSLVSSGSERGDAGYHCQKNQRTDNFIPVGANHTYDLVQRIVGRAHAGRKAARERGARFGRKPTLSAEQQVDARRRLAAGESARSLGRFYRVSHTTSARRGDTA